MPKRAKFSYLLKSIDLYGVGVPKMNIRGEETIKTSTGGCFTLFIVGLTAMFAMLKLQHLFERKSPTVTEYVQ